jgi:hypothetical protein
MSCYNYSKRHNKFLFLMSLTIKKRKQTEPLTGGSIMLYQETYHAGGDPHKLNVSGVIYMHDFTPPHPGF